MKKIIIALATVAFLGSCGKLVEGYDVSPNSPTSATPSLLLSTIEVASFMHHSGQLARQSAILTQQMAGTQFQFEEFATYTILEGDNQNEFNSLYNGAMLNCKLLVERAGAENPRYQGIARVLWAMNLGIVTDLWGDAANREALNGLTGEYNPSYDSQETIYGDLQSMLDQAIVDLSKADGENTILPSTDDFIFGGDADKWLITAHVLKARYHNRLSKRDPAGSATRALASITAAEAAGLDATFSCDAIFGTNGNELNQWHGFELSRADYMKGGKHFVDMLNTMNDPRLSQYFAQDDNGAYSGTASNSSDITTSAIGSFFAQANSKSPMVTYHEAMFIKAEASLRSNQPGPAATAHNEGVSASLTKVTGSANAAYMTNYGSETSSSITLEKIMTQKYIAMFTQIEVYNDWRRTGFPTLTPNPDGVVAGIPRRLPTPLDERLYNLNATVVSNVLTPVWWDQ